MKKTLRTEADVLEHCYGIPPLVKKEAVAKAVRPCPFGTCPEGDCQSGTASGCCGPVGPSSAETNTPDLVEAPAAKDEPVLAPVSDETEKKPEAEPKAEAASLSKSESKKPAKPAKS